MEQIGFIGLGIMGLPMAANLLKAGCSVLVHDVSAPAMERAAALGAVPATVEELGESCTLVFLSLPNGDIGKAVLLGEDGLAARLQPGSLVVDTSSITPEQAGDCGRALAALGIGYLDAPVSGGEPGAIQGTLSFMVGGSEENFRRATPCFEIMGSSAVRIGDVGSGSVAKLANQVIVNLTIAAVSEAMVLAARAGADPEKVFEAIRGGLAGSAVLEAKVPMMLDRNFKPGGKISINRKDIRNVLDAAHSLDVPVPMSAQLYEIFQTLKVQGRMDEDHSAIVRYFEQLAGVTVQRGGERHAQ